MGGGLRAIQGRAAIRVEGRSRVSELGLGFESGLDLLAREDELSPWRSPLAAWYKGHVAAHTGIQIN